MPDVEFKSAISAPAQDVFDWHLRAGAFERLTPPWDSTRVIKRNGHLASDTLRVTLQVPVLGPIKGKWEVRHDQFNAKNLSFRDVMERGPFKRWQHVHSVMPRENDTCEVSDAMSYTLPAAPLLAPIMGKSVARKIARAFHYRHRVTANDIANHSQFPQQQLRIAITGATGLIGRALAPYLATAGHHVVALARPTTQHGVGGPFAERPIAWDPSNNVIDAKRLEGFDVVIHLAGEPLDSRWTEKKREAIMRSRVVGTTLLAATLAKLEAPPQVLISTSATGFYGDGGATELTESSAPGKGFLTAVTSSWEAAADAARDAGIRVVHPRFGIVLSPQGGALGKLLLPFKLGGGGRVGNGRQYWPWVAMDDVLGAIEFCIHTKAISGPVNVAAPGAATCKEFATSLGRVLRRPTIVSVPALALRAIFGRAMATETLLHSALVTPRSLLENGFNFRFPELDPALRHLLGR